MNTTVLKTICNAIDVRGYVGARIDPWVYDTKTIVALVDDGAPGMHIYDEVYEVVDSSGAMERFV